MGGVVSPRALTIVSYNSDISILCVHGKEFRKIVECFFRITYPTLFGGVVMFTKSDFEKVNGFSNVFWGWGAEDDNLYQR